MADEFTRYCAELLGPLGPLRTRRMFGGHGIYVDDLFMALVFKEQLYLKTDAQTRPRFESAGCEPFRYETKDGEQGSLGYFRPPEEAMESPPLMLPWARLAFEAALRAQAAKRAIKPRKAPSKKTKGTSSRKA